MADPSIGAAGIDETDGVASSAGSATGSAGAVSFPGAPVDGSRVGSPDAGSAI